MKLVFYYPEYFSFNSNKKLYKNQSYFLFDYILINIFMDFQIFF